MRFLTVGGVKSSVDRPIPGSNGLLSMKQWAAIIELCGQFESFGNEYLEYFEKNSDEIFKFFQQRNIINLLSEDESQIFHPGKYSHSLTGFQKLMLIRLLRTD